MVLLRAHHRQLVCAAIACVALGVSAPAAEAVPRVVAHSGDYIERVAIDGTNVFWTAAAKLHRTDLTTGLDTVIYKAPRGGYIAEISAGGGRVSARSFVSGRRSLKESLAVGDAAGPLQVVARAASRDYPRGSCGVSLAGGRFTPDGSLIYLKMSYTRTRRHCTGKWKYSAQIFASDPPTSPGVTPLPRKLYTSKLTFPFDPQLVGRTLLVQNTRAVELVNLDTGVAVRKRPHRRSDIYGELDPFGNLVANSLAFSSDAVTSTVYTAASNYSTGGTLLGHSGDDWYYPCGGRLVNTYVSDGRTFRSTIEAVPNPFAPVPGAAQTILPTTKLEIGSLACTAERLAFTGFPAKGSDVYVDDFVG